MTERFALIHPRPFLTIRTGIVLALVAALALFAIGTVWMHGAPLPRTSGFKPLYAASGLLFRRHIFEFAARHAIEPGPRATTVLTVVLGAALGCLITLSSVGAGAIGVTVLIFLYPKMPIARIVGSDIAHAVPLTLIAGAGHWLMGSVDVGLLGSLLVGSIPGIIIASSMTHPRAPAAPDPGDDAAAGGRKAGVLSRWRRQPLGTSPAMVTRSIRRRAGQ